MHFLSRRSPWFGERFRIVDRRPHFHVPKTGAPKTLLHMKRFAGWAAHEGIEPGLVVKTRRVDNQRVAVPLARGVTEPRGVRVVAELTAVHKYLPEEAQLLI